MQVINLLVSFDFIKSLAPEAILNKGSDDRKPVVSSQWLSIELAWGVRRDSG